MAVLALGAAAAGCTDSPTGSSPPDAVGLAPRYLLVSVNGQAVPAAMSTSAQGTTTSVVSGEMTFASNVFVQRLTLGQSDANGQYSSRGSMTQGTVTISGNQIRFDSSDGTSWQGRFTSATLDYALPGNNGPVTFSFRAG